MIKSLFLGLGSIVFLTGCKKNDALPRVSEETAITQKVSQLYTEYDDRKKSIYNQSFSDHLFSPELKKTLEEAVAASNADIEKVKKSDHPDEKPLLIEGAVFSSLYEGFNSYKVKSVAIDPSGTSADADVNFEYTMSPPKVTWTDKVHLIKSGNDWKIDNIRFDSIGSSKDLKASLKEFAQRTK